MILKYQKIRLNSMDFKKMANANKKIKDFIDQKDIIEELGLSNLPSIQKEEIFEKMMDLLMKRVLIRATDELSGDDKKVLIDMAERDAKPDEVEDFVSKKIPSMEEIIKEETESFKKQMIEDKDYLLTIHEK